MNDRICPRFSRAWPVLIWALPFLFAGCQGLPDRVATLEQARSTVAGVDRDPLAGQAAPDHLRRAKAQLAEADDAYEEGEDLAVIEHEAYLALRHAQAAQAQIEEARAREQIAQSEAERTKIQLAARTAEAERAQGAVQSARAAAADAQSEAQRLQQVITDLEAQTTERGLVLTLGDVLFDTAQATLKPGAHLSLDRLATFLSDYPERRVLIEGHTDSVGAGAYNQELSERRAAAVETYLMRKGVDPQRIATAGMGEDFPVAGNNSAGGRQQNRRVEVVISDDAGGFPATVRRQRQQSMQE